MSLIVRLKDTSDTKLTVGGRSFHTFTTLSAKKNLLRTERLDRGLYNLYAWPLVFWTRLNSKSEKSWQIPNRKQVYNEISNLGEDVLTLDWVDWVDKSITVWNILKSFQPLGKTSLYFFDFNFTLQARWPHNWIVFEDGTHIYLSLIHIWRCRRIERCRSRWSPYH